LYPPLPSLSGSDSAASVGTSIVVPGVRWPSFQVCGYTGLLLAAVQAALLVSYLHLSYAALAGIIGMAILTFSALVMATKILFGEEIITYYHHEIAVIATISLFLRFTKQPMLPYLDITVLGIGLFLAFGRLGCLRVGCCHGRPWDWGVTYGDERAQAGFPEYLIGVRLFPIQAVESVFALCLVASGIAAVTKGYPPGTAFGAYILFYAFGRFFFEFVRGDDVRRHLGGFSEAQWTSLLLTVAPAYAEHATLIPRHPWHTFIPLLILASMIFVSAKRHWGETGRFELLHPHHIRELAEAVKLADGTLTPSGRVYPPLVFTPRVQLIDVAQTSLGIRISAGDIQEGNRRARHYTLSSETGLLTAKSARSLGILIARLHHESSRFMLLPASSGVFHLIFNTHPAAASTEFENSVVPELK
jgi:prolipoprotein diacylglyceryl transferase